VFARRTAGSERTTSGRASRRAARARINVRSAGATAVARPCCGRACGMRERLGIRHASSESSRRATSTCWNVCAAPESTTDRLRCVHAAARRTPGGSSRCDGTRLAEGSLPRRSTGRVRSQRSWVPRAHGATVDDVTDDRRDRIWARSPRGAVTVCYKDLSARRFRFAPRSRSRFAGASVPSHSGSRTSASSGTISISRAIPPLPFGRAFSGGGHRTGRYQALDAPNRKGYRYFGTDMTLRTRRSTAASASRLRRQAAGASTATADATAHAARRGREYLTIYGGEAVHANS